MYSSFATCNAVKYKWLLNLVKLFEGV
jgi:hypothetical protein